ncbi:MAG: hypothetical protein ACKV2U_02735 [Bryobacteraceae bacterium]
MWRPDRNKWAPRIGFAWRLTGDGKTVLHGGYGVFYNHIVSSNGIANMFRGLPFKRSEDFTNTPTKVVFTWEIAFSGQCRPSRQWGDINYRDAVGTSNFHALLMRVERRFPRGLSFLGWYTWSKPLDLSPPPATAGEGESPVQDSLNLLAERGLSAFDARRRFINSVVYELPFAKGKPWLRGLQATGILSLQRGRPYTVVTSRDMANMGAAATQTRPNLVGNPVIVNPAPGLSFFPFMISAATATTRSLRACPKSTTSNSESSSSSTTPAAASQDPTDQSD